MILWLAIAIAGSVLCVRLMVEATRRLWLPEGFYAWHGREFRRGAAQYKRKGNLRGEIIQTMQAEWFEHLAAQKRLKGLDLSVFD